MLREHTAVVLFLLVGACEGSPRPLDAASLDAPGVDAPGLDAPTFDAPGLDAPTPSPDAFGADAFATDAPVGSACDGPPGRTVRALYVGNSQIDFWSMPQLVASLSESADPSCPRIEGSSLTMGGANLRDLWELAGLESEITTGGYDVVVIAESIDLVELRPLFPALFEDYAGRIIAASRDAGATPVLYATPYVEALDHTGFHEMANPQLALGAALGVGVAAGGLAWLREWAIRPDLDLYHTDRGHPGFVGSYLSALVIYAEILDASPVGLTEAPMTDCSFGVCTPISRELATELQGVAWEEHLATGGP